MAHIQRTYAGFYYGVGADSDGMDATMAAINEASRLNAGTLKPADCTHKILFDDASTPPAPLPTPLQDMAREAERLSDLPMSAGRMLREAGLLEGPEGEAYAPPIGVLYTTRQYSCGCRAQGTGDVPNYCPEHGVPEITPPKTFTTQLIPTLVFNAARAEVMEMLSEPRARSLHRCVMIHPDDFAQLVMYTRQQGTLDKVPDNSISSLEINGITVMPDASWKVPHLELTV